MTNKQTFEKLNIRDRQSNSNWLFAIYVILTMAIYILPATKLLVPYILAGSLMLVSIVFIMFKNDKFFILSLCLIFFSLIFTTFDVLHGVSLVDSINDFIRNMRLFLPALWALYAINNVGTKQKTVIFWSFIVVSAFILINTLFALEQEPWIARDLAQDQSTSSEKINQYRKDNVGGYPFSYMIGAVTLMFTWLIFICKKNFYKILSIIATVLCFYYIIQTMYTTLLLLTAIGIVIILLVKIKSPMTKGIIASLTILAFFFLPQLIKYVGELFSADSLLSTKFEQIYDSLTGKGVEALGSRPKLISQAIENWAQTPFFGAHYDTPSHSTIFEYLQQTGVFGLALWLTMFFTTWRVVFVALKRAKVYTGAFNIVCTYLAVLSIFNDIKGTFEITIAVFFIMVIFSMLFCKKKDDVGGKNVE